MSFDASDQPLVSRRRASAYRPRLRVSTKPPRRGPHFKLPLPSKWRPILFGGLIAAGLFGALIFIYALWTLSGLPDPGHPPPFANAIEVYDNSGQKIAQVNSQSQYYQSLSGADMGKTIQQATVAAEDRGYYDHGPLDYFALIRASLSDLIHHSANQGASTITQQVVNISINESRHQKSFLWKLQEAVLATALEKKYSKDQILQMYLNRVFYGHNAYGISAAAQVFFGKPANQLDTAESAFLAGLVRGPSYYDPQSHFERAKARQNYVLNQMVRSGDLTQAQADQAASEKLDLKYAPLNTQSSAPHFIDYVRGWLEQKIGADALQQGNLKVYTTLDSNLQKSAVNAVQQGVGRLSGKGVNNGALLAADPQTGAILAWVGSADYNNTDINGQFDVVANGQRQAGSTYKAYVYEAALRSGKITLASKIEDTPYNYPGTNKPVLDWDNHYDGNITAARALLLSRNVPAVKVGQMEGMDNVNDLARSMGVTGNLVDVPSGAIGTSEISVMANVQGYQVFANQGKKVPLVPVTKVVAGDTGQQIYTNQPGSPDESSQVITPAQSWLITSVLHGYPGYWGLGWRTTMAGKSGTTGGEALNQHPDAWMMAYNPKIVIGSWAANTGPGNETRYTSAFGTDVGSTITARFVNALPSAYRGWYSTPSGVTQESGCPGQPGDGLWFLTGTESSNDCPTPTPTPTPTPSPTPTESPTPTPFLPFPGGIFSQPSAPPEPTPTPSPSNPSGSSSGGPNPGNRG